LEVVICLKAYLHREASPQILFRTVVHFIEPPARSCLAIGSTQGKQMIAEK
jgi:hypothetical protein